MNEDFPTMMMNRNARLKTLRDSGATCLNCRNSSCYEIGRHDEHSPGLPCSNYIPEVTP